MYRFVPAVEDVMDARRPKIHEKGKDIANAAEPLRNTCQDMSIMFILVNRTETVARNVILPRVARGSRSRKAC